MDAPAPPPVVRCQYRGPRLDKGGGCHNKPFRRKVRPPNRPHLFIGSSTEVRTSFCKKSHRSKRAQVIVANDENGRLPPGPYSG